jgi:DNA modification methylase
MPERLLLTNEEMRIALYSGATQPIVPHSVTPDTPLESLNLNWREKDLPEKQRTKHVHRLHPYLGKFVPQLVEVFLRKYFAPGQTILDPFCGSGTTLVQANELGIEAVGYDIAAFNVLLTQAKVTHYLLEDVCKEVRDILGKLRAKTQQPSSQLSFWELSFVEKLQETDNSYLQQWYAPQALHELLTYRKLIETEGYHYQDLLKVILARSARSARLTTHFDLDFPKKPQIKPYWCYKHSRECIPTTEAFKFLERYSADTLQRVKEFAVCRTAKSVLVHHADSREVAFPTVHGVITSPPYLGLIDYHEQHAYAYHLLGLADKRSAEIGAAAQGLSQKAKQQYQWGITTVFQRIVEILPSGGRIIVIARDPANLYGEIAAQIGVETEAVLQRHVNRRTGRRSGEFYEAVFIWRKCCKV